MQSKLQYPATLATLLYLAANLLLLSFMHTVMPDFSDVNVSINGGAGFHSTLPYHSPGESNFQAEINMRLTLSRFHATEYDVWVDDCLDLLLVNGVAIPGFELPYCDYSKNATLNFKMALHQGANLITARMRNGGGPGGFHLAPSKGDPYLIYCRLVFLLLLGLYGAFLLNHLFHNTPRYRLGVIFLGGLVLRIIYFFATPVRTRSHDIDGHLDYLRYVMKYYQIPPAAEGWQFYQPPLYYFLGGLWMKLGALIGHPIEVLFREVQLLSVLYATLTLLLALWIGKRIGFQRRLSMTLYAALFATLPGLIFSAGRLTNDTLLHLFAFLMLAALIRWWQESSDRCWYLAAIAMVFALLTKSSAIGLVPVAFGLLALRRNISILHRIKLASVFAVTLAAGTGWLYLLRIFQDNQTSIIGNISGMNSALLVPVNFKSFVVFNPWQFVQIPFNSPWEDAARRTYFWEYFTRSMFFGEFQFGDSNKFLCSLILGLFVILIPFFIFGLYRALRHRFFETAPLWLTLACLMGSMLAYRYRYPYSSAQDFRYVNLIAAPLIYFICYGIERMPRAPKYCGIIAGSSLVVASTLFICRLYLLPTPLW